MIFGQKFYSVFFFFWDWTTYILFTAILKNRQQISKLVLCDKRYFWYLTNLNIGLIFLYIISHSRPCPLTLHLADRFFFVELNCITDLIKNLTNALPQYIVYILIYIYLYLGCFNNVFRSFVHWYSFILNCA